jgi:hypothetical protein
MNLAFTAPQGSLARANPGNAAHLSRQAKSGIALRLAPGLYVVGASLPPEQIARHHLFEIISTYWPGGVLCGLTALRGGGPVDGVVYVAQSNPARPNPLQLPGIRIVPVVGPDELPGDLSMPEGLSLSGPARVLVENVHLRGRPPVHRAGTALVEDRMDELARSGGAGRVRKVLDELDVIAGHFDPAAVKLVRDRLVALLGSFSSAVSPVSPRLAARLAGNPYDAHRIDMIKSITDVLRERPPQAIHSYPPEARWEWLAFFEAYFSNFIEGTEFGVDEARRIAVEGLIPESRPADAHDVAATYRLAVDSNDRVLIPKTGEELVEMLKARHRILMAARTDKRPGDFKELRNFAGGYQFVDPELVEGTLERGFEALNFLDDPFARAVVLMLLVTECHPFDDGNGRVARLTSNAELSAAGQVRIIIPTVFRGDYLAALSGVSSGAGHGESLVAALQFAQWWVAAVDWSTYDGANSILTECNAYLDPAVADRTRRHLILPPREG